MKFAITPYEKLGLTLHLFAQRVDNTEQGRIRLKAWDQLGVSDLADALSLGGTTGGGEVTPADWQERKETVDVELTDTVVTWILKGLAQPRAGAWADTLSRLETRLIEARDAKG